MVSAHAPTQMVESIRASGSMESIRVLGYYQTLQGRSLLGCFGPGGNGGGDPSYRRTVELMGFGMGIGLREVSTLVTRMGTLTLDSLIRIFRSMGMGSINSRITQIVKVSFTMINLSVGLYTIGMAKDTKGRHVITSVMAMEPTTTMMEE